MFGAGEGEGGGVGGRERRKGYRIHGFPLYVCALLATDGEIPGWRVNLPSPMLRRTEMGPENTGCHGEWDGKGSLERLLGSPQAPSALRGASLLPPILMPKDSHPFSCFPSKMVALLSLEPARQLLV